MRFGYTVLWMVLIIIGFLVLNCWFPSSWLHNALGVCQNMTLFSFFLWIIGLLGVGVVGTYIMDSL